MYRHLLCRAIAIALSCFAFAAVQSARADIPDELYKNLKLTKDASPKEVYDAIVKRYYDPKQGHGKGAFADLWEPTPFTRYLEPKTLYVAPDMDFDVKRTECVECHSSVTPGWVHSWQKSVHGNLDEIRSLPAKDSRSYKQELITGVETNLRSMGLLPQDQKLREVGCIDCHMGVGKEAGNHKTDLHMPDAAACGQCHLK
jgi:hydroxylamine dehydrogenase